MFYSLKVIVSNPAICKEISNQSLEDDTLAPVATLEGL